MNNMNYLVLPTTGSRLFSGDVVRLSRFPGMKWILQNGWYYYDGRQQNGWYFSSVPEDTVIPVNDSDLLTLSVISTNNTQQCPPFYPGGNPQDCLHLYPPHPPHPEDNLGNKSMITVDTITERNALCSKHLQHGRIVRVNDVKGEVKYYEWDAIKFTWIDVELGQGTIKTLGTFADALVVKSTQSWEDSDEQLATCKAVTDQIKKVSGPEWGTIQ